MNRGGFERVWGGGPDGQIVSIQKAWASRGKSLLMSSTNRMKRTGPSTNPLSDAEGAAVGTTNLDFSSTIRKERAYPKNEARGEFEREEFVKQSRVPDRVESLGEVNRCQNGSVWRFFLLEAVPD